jgi:adenylate cyclase
LAAYKERQWDQAVALFQDALHLAPADTPSGMYINRCREYRQHLPTEDWDGVFTMTMK